MNHSPRFSRLLVTSLKIFLLTVVMFVLFSTIYTITGVATDPSLAAETITPTAGATVDQTQEVVSPAESSAATSADPARAATILVGVCFLQTLALSAAILRSRWAGWKLILAMFTVMTLGTAILSHIDSLFFLQDMSRTLIAKLVVASTLLSASFSAIAVWVLGKRRDGGSGAVPSDLEHHSRNQWILIIASLTILHIFLYFFFGYYVAWKSPELRAFYGGEDPGSFWLQMVSVVQGTPWLIPIQVLRGALWGLMAIILARSLTGSRWSAACISAAIMVTVFALPLALPNPLMPDAVRQAHLIETVLSRGLYGFLAVWLLRTPLHSRHAHPKPA